LQSYKTFYKYHGFGKNKNYLARKVEGYTSSIKWLEYQEKKAFSQLKEAMKYDIKTGIYIRHFKSKLKGTIFRLLANFKRHLSRN
jgi:hypothetical protein